MWIKLLIIFGHKSFLVGKRISGSLMCVSKSCPAYVKYPSPQEALTVTNYKETSGHWLSTVHWGQRTQMKIQ